jgi:hypothetical protein
MGHHRGGDVDAVYASVGNAAHKLGRDPARTAAGIQHDLVAPKLLPLELLHRPLKLGIGYPIVGCGVPVARRHVFRASVARSHKAVVTGPERSRSRS